MQLPLALKWVHKFVDTLVPLELHAWDLLETADPLRVVLHLRFLNKFSTREFQLVREMLKPWCEMNDCVYKRSVWKKWDFKAVIILKGLGPVQNKSPFD